MKAFRFLFAAIALAATAAFAHADDRIFVAYLYGGQERPVLGDLDAYGTATVTINSTNTFICYSIILHNAAVSTAAHIHSGAPQVAGGIALALPVNASTPLRVANCVGAPAPLIASLRTGSQNFYVNVHNGAFPGGAARGQLE